MLNRFRRPRWQHSRADVRRQALEQLSMQDDDERRIVERLAQADPDVPVRKAAVKKLDGFGLLRRCMETDTDSGVCEAAAVRYRQLLAGGRGGDDIQERVSELGRCTNPRILAHVARGAREEAVRLAALELCADAGVLADAAVNDPVARVRQAAVKALEDGEALQRVAERTRHGDHKVSRLARERLQAQQADAEEARRRARERDAILGALEAMVGGEEPANAAEVARLENRWQGVAEGVPEEQQRRFTDLTARARRRSEEAAAARAARQEASRRQAAADPERVLADLQAAAEPEPAQLDRLEQVLGVADPGEVGHAGAEAYLAAARRYVARSGSLTELIRQLDEAAAPASGEDDRYRRIRELLNAVDWPDRFPPPRALQQARRMLANRRAAETRDDSVSRARLEELHALLREVDQALGQGNLRAAQRALKGARGVAEALPGSAAGGAERKLRQATARVAELRDWRRFATLPKQEQLCERMEALIGADMPPEELATAIKGLQDEWKETGGSDSAESRRLWERFHAAGERAFEPCRAHYEALAEERQRNLAERERIADQLEAFMEQADWDELDAARLRSIRAKAREEWNAFSPVDRKPAKPVTRRFEALMDRLTEHLREKQEGNRRRKQALLDQARELDGAMDIGSRIDAAKRLQQEWQQIGPAQPAQERKLHRAFKRVCDAVFAERDARRDAERRERDEHQAAAEALCARVEALAADPAGADDAALRAAAAEAEAEFAALGPLPQRTRDAVSRRFERALQGLRERAAAAEAAERRAEREVLRGWAALCERLEGSIQRGESPDLDALRQQWQAGAAVDERAAEVLEARWARALAALERGGFDAAEATQAEEACRRLCVRMEILAGVDSPDADADLRMALQVERLSDGLAGGARELPGQAAKELELEWLGTGPATERISAELEPRFRRALDAALGG